MLESLQFRLGRTAVGPSTARRMGPPGTIAIARSFLQEFDIISFQAKSRSRKNYLNQLNHATFELAQRLPYQKNSKSVTNGCRWGSARKFINIFLRNCAYNKYICEKYRLEKLEPWMEVPLDSHVARGLKQDFDGKLPRWINIIDLTPDVSTTWQNAAQIIADRKGIYRVHLDVLYWNGNKL